MSKRKGDPAIEPTVETTPDKTYPIARPMYFLRRRTWPHVTTSSGQSDGQKTP
jgi:hypothetical protein